LFDTDEERERFAAATSLGIRLGDDPASRLGNANDMLSVRIRRLESVLARLDLFPEPAAMQQPAPKLVGDGRSVFVVHGHDLAAKQETARMIEKLRLTAVILDEQANRGRTIIEKFEDHARECVYAVVLLTADDLGRAKIATEDEPRARQNVIFEMGYFMARLGRGHVCALVAHGLKQPSDIHGLGWVELDAAGAWKAKVAKEMKDAGLPVDMNDLF
jgi:predicted nucleotide-binding protein